MIDFVSYHSNELPCSLMSPTARARGGGHHAPSAPPHPPTPDGRKREHALTNVGMPTDIQHSRGDDSRHTTTIRSCTHAHHNPPPRPSHPLPLDFSRATPPWHVFFTNCHSTMVGDDDVEAKKKKKQLILSYNLSPHQKKQQTRTQACVTTAV